MKSVGGYRLEGSPNPTGAFLFRLGAIVVGIAIGTVLAQWKVGPDADVYTTVFLNTIGTGFGIGNILVLATPLILASLAVAVPYRLGLWNIGAEGQLYMGAWAAALVAFSLRDLPAPLLQALMLVGAALGGGAWMLGPAVLRAYLNVHEIVTTLLLNFVAAFWTSYWLTGPWRPSSSAGGVLHSDKLPPNAFLPPVTFDSVQFHSGLFVAVVIAVVMAWALANTRLGFALQVMRSGEKAALYTGIPVRRTILGVLLCSGALAGVAGAVEMMGNIHTFATSLSGGSGYTAIVVAVLAGGSLAAVIPLALMFGGLDTAALSLRVLGVSNNAAFALTGMILMLAAAAQVLSRYRLVKVGYPVRAAALAPEPSGQAGEPARASKP